MSKSIWARCPLCGCEVDECKSLSTGRPYMNHPAGDCLLSHRRWFGESSMRAWNTRPLEDAALREGMLRAAEIANIGSMFGPAKGWSESEAEGYRNGQTDAAMVIEENIRKEARALSQQPATPSEGDKT